MNKLIIYNTPDGESAIALYAKDGSVWLNQNQLVELFTTSVPNISMHISNILKEGELTMNSVIKDYLTTQLAAIFSLQCELKIAQRPERTFEFSPMQRIGDITVKAPRPERAG